MRTRWLGSLVTLAACAGGARETVHALRVDPGTAPRVQPRASVAPRDEAPTLVTVRGRRGASTDASSYASPPSASPASGGYFVRSTAAPTGGSVAMDSDRGGAAGTTRSGSYASGSGSAGTSASSSSSVGMTPSSVSPSPARQSFEYRPRAPAAVSGMRRSVSSATAPRVAANHASARPATTVVPSAGGAGASVEAIDGVADVVAEAPAVVVVEQQVPAAGRLTAASVGDADRRDAYLDYLARHDAERESLGLDMSRRVRFRVVDATNHPVNDAHVSVSGAGVQFDGRTHADGSWDFFPSIVAPQASGALTVRADLEGHGNAATVVMPSAGDLNATVVMMLPAIVAPTPPALDLAFAIDVTGSMSDELRYVNGEIENIVHRVEAEAQGVRVRVSSTFYRDRVDAFVVQQIPFTANVPGFAQAMLGVNASGGGDYPEDMNAGLEAAMTRLAWSDGHAVRVLVVIADAPPQPYADEQFNYRQTMIDASRRGIRILPVAASGADRSVEYLFRAMGAFTSTPYVYLTDDSGVGNAHMEADTDRVGVERFNDMLVRMISSDLRGQGMHEPGALGPQTG